MKNKKLFFKVGNDPSPIDENMVKTTLNLQSEHSTTNHAMNIRLSGIQLSTFLNSNFRLLVTTRKDCLEDIYTYQIVYTSDFLNQLALNCLLSVNKKLFEDHMGIGDSIECISFIETICNKLNIQNILIEDKNHSIAEGLFKLLPNNQYFAKP